MNKYIQPLIDTISLLLNPYSFSIGVIFIKNIKNEIIQDFNTIDGSDEQVRKYPEVVVKLIENFNYIAQIEFYLNQTKDLAISLNYLSVLYYKYFRITKDHAKNINYLEMSIDAMDHAIYFEPDSEIYIKNYYQSLKNYAYYIRDNHSEIAEEIYFRVIEFCIKHLKEKPYLSLIQSACYDGLGNIYFKCYENKKLSFNEKEKYLDLSYHYYVQALNILIKPKTFNKNTNSARNLAHILNTVLIEKSKCYIDVIRNGHVEGSKFTLLTKLEKCYVDAMSYAKEYGETRKLGISEFKYANFLFENQKSLKVESQEILFKMEDAIKNMLHGYFKEGQINENEFNRYYKKYLSILESDDTFQIKIFRFAAIKDALIKPIKSKEEYTELKKKRNYNQTLFKSYDGNNNSSHKRRRIAY